MAPGGWGRRATRARTEGGAVLDNRLALDRFLAAVERRAYTMARLATGDGEEALDIVQDAMLRLVQRYADRPQAEWAPLFHRILQHRIRDWHRRRRVRRLWGGWFGRAPADGADEDGGAPPWERVADPASPEPLRELARREAGEQILSALERLPLRQQQVFLLRVWEGLDVAATAAAMGCSQGSVKTHLSRALARLRQRLEREGIHENLG